MAFTSVDPQALRLAAQRLDRAADLLESALRGHLNTLQFPAAAAGLRHIDLAGAARARADQLMADVAQWQQGAREAAFGLRTVAERRIDQDERGREALR